MFQDSLNRTLEHVEGTLGCLLIGFDGIPIATVFHDEAFGREVLMPAIVELSGMFGKLGRAEALNRSGATRETRVITDGLVIIARVVQAEYLLVLALDPSADLQRGSRALRLIAPWVEEMM